MLWRISLLPSDKAPVQYKKMKRKQHFDLHRDRKRQVPVALWLDTPTEWTLFRRKKRSQKCHAVMSLDEAEEMRLAPAPPSSRRQVGKEESATNAVG
ncbi:hypothetical protein ROHU_026580 [Labeo rohita]|uniref:Uncharacterized protein n=1 Tax=Labeo rohita TaxID=84645 RepID=A0A498MD42_LABRO|nr:hypothetical protein ROHU_026580 [Labeo rohita]